MQNENKDNFKYVFGRLEDCTAFKNTGVLQDEGQYLQDVYPPDVECGGTGAYRFDPRSHLTEASPSLTSENIIRLHTSWHSYWDNSKQISLKNPLESNHDAFNKRLRSTIRGLRPSSGQVSPADCDLHWKQRSKRRHGITNCC